MLAILKLNFNHEKKVCIIIKEYSYDKEKKYTFYKVLFDNKILTVSKNNLEFL